MRSKAKFIIPLALLSAIAVAGLSRAAGEDNKNGKGAKASASPAPPTASVADGAATNGGAKVSRPPGGRFALDIGDADVRAVLEDVRTAVSKQVPDIVGPVIQKAQDDGKITAAQADKLRATAQSIADGKHAGLPELFRDRDVHQVIRDSFAAVTKKVPDIAEPIIAKAAADGKITDKQADRIREAVKHLPPAPASTGRLRASPARHSTRTCVTCSTDIHAAVGKQAAGIANPIIDKAEQDGKITEAQADKLHVRRGRGRGRQAPEGTPVPQPRPARRRRAQRAARRLRGNRKGDDRHRRPDHREGGVRQGDHGQAGCPRSGRWSPARARFHLAGPRHGHGPPGLGPPPGFFPGAPPPPPNDRGAEPLAPARPGSPKLVPPTDVRCARSPLKGAGATTDSECMKRLSLVVVALFALTLPVAAQAQGGSGHKKAAKECKALGKKNGRQGRCGQQGRAPARPLPEEGSAAPGQARVPRRGQAPGPRAQALREGEAGRRDCTLHGGSQERCAGVQGAARGGPRGVHRRVRRRAQRLRQVRRLPRAERS